MVMFRRSGADSARQMRSGPARARAYRRRGRSRSGWRRRTPPGRPPGAASSSAWSSATTCPSDTASPGTTRSTTPAPALTGWSALGPARAEPPRGHADAPWRRWLDDCPADPARTSSTSGAPRAAARRGRRPGPGPSGASGPSRGRRRAPSAGSASMPASASISRGEGEGDLDHVGRPAALQDLERLPHLQGVADGQPERGVHAGDEGDRAHPVVLAQRRPSCGRARAPRSQVAS